MPSGELSGPTPDRQGDFSVEDARTALVDLADALPVEQWRWYVISGTFLGIVREGGFLAHDYDIDVGVTFDPEHPEVLDDLVAALRRSPRYVVKKLDDAQTVVEVEPGRYAVERAPALVKLIHENGINVDVFVHHRDGDRLWHGSSIHRWENSAFDLTDYTLAGVPVLGPADADRYLTENYGDWRTPVTAVQLHDGHTQPRHHPVVPVGRPLPHPPGPLRPRRPRPSTPSCARRSSRRACCATWTASCGSSATSDAGLDSAEGRRAVFSPRRPRGCPPFPAHAESRSPR